MLLPCSSVVVLIVSEVDALVAGCAYKQTQESNRIENNGLLVIVVKENIDDIIKQCISTTLKASEIQFQCR